MLHQKFVPIFVIFFLLGLSSLTAQVAGKVTDEKGISLPFANVYVQGTTQGTTTNADGNYHLDLKKGTYSLVFQYVGYKQQIEKITLSGKPIHLNVSLSEQILEIEEVTIKANAEDPAYAIIRNAIEKRDYYKKIIAQYSCDVYIKGKQRFLDAPKKLLGREVGNMGGILDTNRQGIIYLSESQSKLYFKKPNLRKEIIVSAKVSGNERSFGFNRVSMLSFDFYDNTLEVGDQSVLSPIANSALQYYKFKLLGKFEDKNDNTIHKIAVIPKRNEDPVFRGNIYITDNLWNIESADLMLLGVSIKQPLLDTLWVKQAFLPVIQPDVWCLFSQDVKFKAGAFGFKVAGSFLNMFSDYNLNPDFPPNLFNDEIIKIEKGSNKKDTSFWNSTRPIPLTIEEQHDYVKKDNLRKMWDSKKFRDSIDVKNNKFRIVNLFTSYTWQNSFKKQYFTVNSPISTIGFNAVQGWAGNLKATFSQNIRSEEIPSSYSINGQVQYGLSEKKLRGSIGGNYSFNQTNFAAISGEIGVLATPFMDNITPSLNDLYSLLGKKNYLRLYEKAFATAGYEQELWNGVFFKTNIAYEQRVPLENTSNYSFYKKEVNYEPNNNLKSSIDARFPTHQAFIFNAAVRLCYKQQFTSYPDRKIIEGSTFPDLWIRYRKGVAALGSDVNYDFLSVNVQKEYIKAGLLGYSELNIGVGTFLNKNNLYFTDYKHFRGNKTFIQNPNRFMESFLTLPYFEYSTNQPYFEGHWQHHLQGFLLDKIPLVRKLAWKEVIGANYLYTKDQKDYLEFSFGFENIGFGLFRLFRIDVVTAFRQGKYEKTAFVFGITTH